MTERRGMHRLLDSSRIYSAFQSGIARPETAELVRSRLFPELGGRPVRVLDLGCGPAAFLSAYAHIGGFTYVGFDPNERYIDKARLRFPEAELHVGAVPDVVDKISGPFDLAVAQGVLHHVDDQSAIELAGFAASHLAAGGRLVAIDPVLFAGQHLVASMLAHLDRGKYVRRVDEYRTIVEAAFDPGSITTKVESGWLRVPYNHCVVVARRP